MSELPEHTIEIDRRYHRDRLMDIIGHPPGWLLRSGTGLIAFITALLLCLAWFIRYPDIIEAPVVITSDHPPVEIYSNHTGIIDSVYVSDGERIKKDQILLVMSNAAHLKDVILWKDWLTSSTLFTEPDSLFNAPPSSLSLGELHPAYTVISQKYQEWYRWVIDESVKEKIRAYRSEIKTIGKLMASQQQQIDIYVQELSLQEKSLGRDESLHRNGVISAADFEKSTSGFLSATRQKESIATGMLTHQMRMNQLEALILDQEISYTNQLQALRTALQTICREALAAIVRWDDQYIVRAKIPGILSIPGQLVRHGHTNAGEPLMTVLPADNESGVYARAAVSGKGLGKIEVGDRVAIRLEAWPYKQFGSLKSEVQQIAQMAVPGEEEGSTFELRMSLDSPVLTTTGQSLHLKPQESGIARIITRDRRILERLFDQLIQLTNINP